MEQEQPEAAPQPVFTLDGRQIPIEPGDSILKAAWRQGIEIPHYCWHPGLSVAANCRMCLVEVRSGRVMALPVLRKDEATGEFVSATKPKLAPACQTPATPGAEVYALSPEAKGAHHAVQEMLLLNHPVDCPICDQAGECKLQDYWYDNQADLKRKLTEPVHKPKAVRFGETIVYDAERCIMCTRCIRFCTEVAKDPVLDMRERGNRNEVVLAPGRTLDHRYTLMTEHVCPVGALTSRDFRFKARVWFLKTAPSVCSGCATGCNTFADFDPRKGQLFRLRPRDNPEVNTFWMCDDGMLSYREVHEQRLLGPTQSKRDGAARIPDQRLYTEPDVVLAEAIADVIKRDASLAFVANAALSTEDNTALLRLAKALGHSRVYLAGRPAWEGDDILRNPDHNPNRAGVQAAASELEMVLVDAAELVNSATHFGGVLWLGTEHAVDVAELRQATSALWVLGTHQGELAAAADLALPVLSWAEQSGTYTNAKGTAQSFSAVIPPVAGQPSAAVLLTLVGEVLQSLDGSNATRPSGATFSGGLASGTASEAPSAAGQGEMVR